MKIEWKQVFSLVGPVVVFVAITLYAQQVLTATLPIWFAVLSGVALWLSFQYAKRTDLQLRAAVVLFVIIIWYELFWAFHDPKGEIVALAVRPWMTPVLVAMMAWIAIRVYNDWWHVARDALTIVDTRMYRPGEKFFSSPFLRYEVTTIMVEQELTVHASTARTWKRGEKDYCIWPWVRVRITVDLEKMKYALPARQFNKSIYEKLVKLFFRGVGGDINAWVESVMEPKKLNVENIPVRVVALDVGAKIRS